MGTTAQKLEYLGTTKSQLKDMINYGLPTENQITNETTFRNYVKGIFEAFLESLRDSTTLYTNLPKISGNGTQITLNDTANAPMRITLKASELSQDATPTPDNPQDIHTISGSNSVVVSGANLFDKSTETIGYTLDLANGTLITASNRNTSDFISVKPSTKYCCSTTMTRIVYYNSNKLFISNETTKPSTTAPSNASYMRFSYDNTTISNIMLNEGNTTLPYEPYIEPQTAQLNLGVENLIDYGTQSFTTFYQKAGLNIPAGTYTFSALVTSSDTQNTKSRVYFYNSAGNISQYVDLGRNTRTSGIVTTTFDIDRITLYSSIDYASSNGKTATYEDIMLEKGTKANSYTPYGTTPIEYCKIGNYEDEFILTSGKNSFSTDYKTTDTLTTYTKIDNNSFSYTCSGTWKGATFVVLCEKNTDYFINYNEYNPNNRGTYCEVKGGQTNTSLMARYHDYLITFNSGENTSLKITISNGTASDNTSGTISNIQLEKGTSASSYEPYGTNQWYLKKNIGKVVLDGDWNWGTQGTTNYQVTLTGTNKLGLATSGTGMSNYFSVASSGTSIYLFPILQSGTDYLRVSNATSQWATTTDFKTFLTNNEVYLYYLLATPTYTQITGTLETQLNNIYEKLLSYKGTTNISQVNNDLPFVLGVSAIQDL